MLSEYEIMIYLMAEVYYQLARICHNGLKWSKKSFHDSWIMIHTWWKPFYMVTQSFQIIRLRLSGLEAISDFYSKNYWYCNLFRVQKRIVSDLPFRYLGEFELGSQVGNQLGSEHTGIRLLIQIQSLLSQVLKHKINIFSHIILVMTT